MSRLRTLFIAGLGGALSTLVDVCLVVLLVRGLGVPVLPGAFIASASGAVVCFLANKYIAFQDRSPIRVDQVIRFGLVAVASALLSASAMHLAVEKLGAPIVPARLAVAVLVFLAWAYPAQRRLVWRRLSTVTA